MQDGINAFKSIDSLVHGDLEGAAEHFRDISYVQTAEEFVDVGKSVIEGDWENAATGFGRLATEAAISAATGRGVRKGGRKGGKKKKVDQEVKKENHSENRDKRSTDHEERKRDNEQEGKKKACKKRSRSRRATKKSPSNSDCENDDDEDDDTKYCPRLSFSNLLEKSKQQTTQCGRTKKDKTCDFECDVGYDERPDHRLKCVANGDKLRWNRQQSAGCVLESCTVRGVRHLIVMSTPKPNSIQLEKITAYVVLFDKDRKIPKWSVAIHDSKEFGMRDLTGLTPKESAGRLGHFLKHPCHGWLQLNFSFK